MAKQKTSKAKPAAKKAAESGYVPRLRERYAQDIVPKLQKEFDISNTEAVPRIEKVSLNIGLGEASRNFKLLEAAKDELGAIAGQAATITRAKKSIAAFKLREGTPIGCRVTLRGQRMWDFLDRLISTAIAPRARLQRRVGQELRRPRQLHAGYSRTRDFSRGRHQQGGGHERSQYNDRHLAQ